MLVGIILLGRAVYWGIFLLIVGFVVWDLFRLVLEDIFKPAPPPEKEVYQYAKVNQSKLSNEQKEFDKRVKEYLKNTGELK